MSAQCRLSNSRRYCWLIWRLQSLWVVASRADGFVQRRFECRRGQHVVPS